MPTVVYVQPDGRENAVEVPTGDSLMDGALDNGIPGILGQCGGGCTCLTCHCYIHPAWVERVPEADADEQELLSYVAQPGTDSRLACQIRITPALAGIRVLVPAEQL